MIVAFATNVNARSKSGTAGQDGLPFRKKGREDYLG
jgi:hypothetical protein